MNVQMTKKVLTFNGHTSYFEHESKYTKTKMKFSTYIPEGQSIKNAIVWLSGLTCNEENFITKSGVQRLLKNSNTMVICPDTSPRGLSLPGEHESYDFGSGAGFYLNATTEGYKDHYRMYDYISKEIVEILKSHFKVSKISIMGHSMGGHGALVLGLKEKDLFKSVSAFSPIVNPILSKWGQKAFNGYFGEDSSILSPQFDATEIIKSGVKRKDQILIDQGTDDEFFHDQLLTDNFSKECQKSGQEVKICYRDGYDHSYFYISTFLDEHIEFHLKSLNSN